MPPPTVVLFDIDGTLVSTAGAGRRAMVAAFRDLVGSDPCDFSFAGMTDRAIARSGLTRAGREPTADAIDLLLERYVTHLERETADSTHFRVFAGIHRALDVLSSRPTFAVGLGTGNIRRGAALKLTPVGLHSRFDFGGFGCDAEDRAELIGAGMRRGAERLGASLDACRLVVVGDTPRDVAAAHANGGECIAVATGSFTTEALARSGAAHAYSDLSVDGALEALLGSAGS